MKAAIVTFLLVVSFQVFDCALAKKSYADYVLVDIVPSNAEDVKYLMELMATKDGVDFWIQPRKAGEASTVMMPMAVFQFLRESLKSRSMFFVLRDDNIQDMIDENMEQIKSLAAASNDAFNLDNFNELKKVYDWMDSLPSKCPQGFSCHTYSLGNSHLGKPIKAFKITKGTGRKAWYFDATTHAREWISTATVLKILNQLVTVADSSAQNFLDKYDFYFVPVVNPDGYDHTWTTDRMWRKNLKEFNRCIGVDLNRNFAAFNWGKEGASKQVCSQTYMGPSAGSEAETIAVSNELRKIGKNTIVMYSLHSYGNMYLIPFGNTVDHAGTQCHRTDDHDEVMVALNAAADATEATYGTKWPRGNACEVIYPTTGSTDEFARDQAGIKYCVVPELRGTNFVLPPSQIELSFQEIYNGLIALEKNIKLN